jgi:hypothetical protein
MKTNETMIESKIEMPMDENKYIEAKFFNDSHLSIEETQLHFRKHQIELEKNKIENTENGSSLNILKDFKTTVSFDSPSAECSTKVTFVESGIKEELKINTINEIKKIVLWKTNPICACKKKFDYQNIYVGIEGVTLESCEIAYCRPNSQLFVENKGQFFCWVPFLPIILTQTCC